MPNMRSLKVGDRVKYVGKHPGYSESYMKGKQGTVTRLYAADSIYVNWDNYQELGHFPENLELLVEPPVAPEGPFYVIAVPGLTFATIEEAEEHAKGRAAKSSGTYAVFKGLKAFKLPTVAQEVPLAP